MNRPPTLLILGDSITLGVADTDGSRASHHVDTPYTRLLAAAFPNLTIVADAAVHRTTTDALALLPALLDRHAPDAVLLHVGGNDAEPDWKRFVLSEGRVIRHRVAVDRYAANLEQLVQLTRAAGALPLLTTFAILDADARGQHIARIANRDVRSYIQRAGGQPEWDRRRDTYVRALTDLAVRTQTPLLSYAESLDPSPDARLFGPDGTHPNDAGHAVIAASLIPQLAPLLPLPLLEGVR